ncbi:MAG TPA: hypothetical protein VFL62_18105 [Bradyrhizobium sp.]|uniref:hypothetical protein n=1 Tax=Bradyrhizobium sp. TaxID=376 RepID=UPI002D7F4E76|nr:hypothetical protein [Bradyrhizobium sp.]HET7888139.1 hypothetical protein [Bradyrhizobium sp.]
MTRHALLLTLAFLTSVQGAAAQAPPTATTPPPPTAIAAADDCAPTAKPAVPRPNREPGTTTGQAAEPLGDKLARSDGVLCPPPGVDPEIRAPTPDAGNTPVIPPPGSPGGNPDVRPK